MGEITVVNSSSEDIYVSVTASGGDLDKGGSEGWYPLKAHGGSDSWGHRVEKQVIRFTRSQTPGVLVETVLGVPGTTVDIH
ncbi:hypothetical protein MMC07_004796 [Pseudocyphellaria aurata]|nr:hypothetical protein [Pseudocyphellaria aurata]